jgi:CheY-like chemotaxis protein
MASEETKITSGSLRRTFTTCRARSSATIRIVFADINLPGSMDCLRLAEALRHRTSPPIELVLTSGHTKVSVVDLPTRAFPRKGLTKRPS